VSNDGDATSMLCICDCICCSCVVIDDRRPESSADAVDVHALAVITNAVTGAITWEAEHPAAAPAAAAAVAVGGDEDAVPLVVAPAAPVAAAAPADYTDASTGGSAARLAPDLAALLTRAAGVASGDARLWRLAAALAAARGRGDDALECRLKEVRVCVWLCGCVAVCVCVCVCVLVCV
jgi:hypothetical protein